MLEERAGKAGRAVLYYNGRQLCSQYNPEREAQAWLDKHTTKIESKENIALLSIGAGYGLQCLIKRFGTKNIFVFEPNQELVFNFKKNFPVEYKKINIISDHDINNSNLHEKIKNLIKTSFVIIKDNSAHLTNESFYDELEQLLTGRSERGFRIHLSTRPDLEPALMLRVVGDGLISIKDLVPVASKTSCPSNPAQLKLLALKELVA